MEESIDIEGSTGVDGFAATEKTTFSSFGDFRTHNGGHYINSNFDTASFVSDLRMLRRKARGLPLQGRVQVTVTVKSDKDVNSNISLGSCPCFDSNHNYKSSLSSLTQKNVHNRVCALSGGALFCLFQVAWCNIFNGYFLLSNNDVFEST